MIQAFCASAVRVDLCATASGKEHDSMMVNFVDQWYRLPDWASRPRFSVEGPFGLTTQALTMENLGK